MKQSEEIIICEIHGILEGDQGSNTDEQFQAQKLNLCPQCSQNQTIPIQSQFLKENIMPEFFKQSTKISETTHYIFETLQEVKQKINIVLDEQINFVRDFIKTINRREKSLKNLLSQLNPSIEQIKKQHQQHQCSFDAFKDRLFNQIFICVNHLLDLRNEVITRKFELLELISEFPKQNKNYLVHHTLKQEEECKAMAFNFNDTILAAGCGGKIIFFNFKDKTLKYHSEIQMHERVVFLKFIGQQFNQLLSVSDYGCIHILEQNSNKEFIIQQEYTPYFFDVTCVDQSQNWLVVGNKSGNLSFWRQKKNQWLFHQQFKNLDELLCVSLNYSCSKLISGGQKTVITIFQLCNNNWNISQKINVKSEVLRVNFFGNQFMCYEPRINQLSIYKFEGDNFKKQSSQKLQGNGKDIQYYPIYRSKNGFVIKHSNYLSFLNYTPIQKKCELNLQMYFGNEKFLGCLSNNEDYLIIWDEEAKEYQVRKLMKPID